MLDSIPGATAMLSPEPHSIEESELALASVSLYQIKIRALREGARRKHAVDECTLTLTCGYREGISFTSLREIPLSLPIVSDGDESYGISGQWYEQTLFIPTDEVINTLRWQAEGISPECSIVVRHDRIFFDRESSANLLRTFDAMSMRTAELNGKKYKPFMGMEEAAQFVQLYVDSLGDEKFPQLEAIQQTVAQQGPLIGIVGDEGLAGMLESSCRVLRISPQMLGPVEAGAFDAILLQERSVGIAPRSSALADERKFTGDLARALSKTPSPILELLSSVTEDTAAQLRSVKNVPEHIAVVGREYEFCDVAPVRGKDWNRNCIAIPCASDLYQHAEFQALATQLLENGYSLAISECNFDHVPARTWERFRSGRVKVYGRLAPRETAELFRNCGFVLLPGISLRPLVDIENLAVMALKAGALPIVVGRQLASPLDRIIDSAYGYPGVHDFLVRNSTLLGRERHWLSRFRALQRSLDKASLASTFGGLLRGRGAPLRPRTPAAEMICVSKRPENFPTILANLQRQSYSNLSMHLIWNVAHRDAEHCLRVSRGKLPNLRVSIVDETRNIGSCLNFGIRESDADYWFKTDDDDYYGSNYVEDGMNFFRTTGAPAMGKPFALVRFLDSNEVCLRSHAAGSKLTDLLRSYPERPFVCGATLSAKVDSDVPLFSTEYRNSCDSKWMEAIRERGIWVFCSDIFNFVTYRGDARAHTWQVSNDQLRRAAKLVSNVDLGGWYDAS